MINTVLILLFMFRILNDVYVFNIVLSLSRVYFAFRVMFRINFVFINLYYVLIVIRIFEHFVFKGFSFVTSYIIIKCRVVILFNVFIVFSSHVIVMFVFFVFICFIILCSIFVGLRSEPIHKAQFRAQLPGQSRN